MIVCATSAWTGRADAATKTKGVYINADTKRVGATPVADDEPLRPVNSRELRSNEEIEIVIVRSNPFLFKYATKVELIDTEDHKAALALAKALGTLLGRFDSSGGSGNPVPAVVEGLDLAEFRNDIQTVTSGIQSIGAWIDDSLEATTDAKLTVLKARVNAGERLKAIERIRAAFPTAMTIWSKCLSDQPLTGADGMQIRCDDPFERSPFVDKLRLQLRFLAVTERDLPASRAVAAAAIAERDRFVAAAKAAAAQGEQAKLLADAAATAASGRADAANTAVKALDAQAAAIAGEIAKADAEIARANTAGLRGLTIRAFINGVVPAREEILRDAGTLESFAKDFDGLMKETSLGTFGYSLQIQKITVQITAQTKYAAFLSASAKKVQASQAKEYVVEVSPQRAAFLRPGVAFVLGFVRNPTFSTKKEGDQFRIVQEDDELTRFNVAAMVNIQPRSWSEPTFGGFFQVGVSPKNDETGFFFGAGISSESLFTFGAGFMYQQVRTLAAGLSVTEPIAKPEDLKTTTTFKPGLYVHATVSLPK
jgi:hypothetical protein